MAVTKFDFSLNVYDEQGQPLRSIKVELVPVSNDQTKQQPVIIVTDRDTGFSVNMKLPHADYTSLQKAFDQAYACCDLQAIPKIILSVMAIFSPAR